MSKKGKIFGRFQISCLFLSHLLMVTSEFAHKQSRPTHPNKLIILYFWTVFEGLKTMYYTKGKVIETLKQYVICFELELSAILNVFLLLITDSTISVPIWINRDFRGALIRSKLFTIIVCHHCIYMRVRESLFLTS